eukprot:5848760-Heterocapsa_arctica.AAC.1
MINIKIRRGEQGRLHLLPRPGQLHICQMAGQHQRDEGKALAGRWKEGGHRRSNPRTRMDLCGNQRNIA